MGPEFAPVSTAFESLFTFSEPFAELIKSCSSCDYLQILSQYSYYLIPIHYSSSPSIQHGLNLFLADGPQQLCPNCHVDTVFTKTIVWQVLTMWAFELFRSESDSQIQILATISTEMGSMPTIYRLFAIVYLGEGHFVSQILQSLDKI